MNIFTFALIAASFASVSNFFFRKCSSSNDGSYKFLFFFYLVSFITSFFVRPGQTFSDWEPIVFMTGCLAGGMNVAMMLVTSRALRFSSVGLTFTFQNASSVFPNAILFMILGSSFGFIVTGEQVVGMSLILLGLCIGIFNQNESKTDWKLGIKYALGCFFIQTAILCIFQGRLAFFAEAGLQGSDSWFMIGFFSMALVFQTFILLANRNSAQKNIVPNEMPVKSKKETLYGSLGGIANALSTFFLLQATRIATPIESGLLFPIFAVSVIVMCNLWGYFIYSEKPKYTMIALCSAGIIIASFGQ